MPPEFFSDASFLRYLPKKVLLQLFRDKKSLFGSILGTKPVRFARVLKLVKIRLHHVKEHKILRLGTFEPGSRMIGFMDL